MASFVWPPLISSLSPSSFPLLAPNGSASAPSYSFTNNPNTGMYTDGTNLDFAAGGNNVASFSPNGAFTLGLSGSTQQGTLFGSLLVTQSVNGANTIIVKNTDASDAGANSAFEAIAGANSAFAYNLYAPNNGLTNWFSGTLGSNLYSINYGGSSGSPSGSTVLFTINPSTNAVSISGTNTNDNAAAGFVGQYVESIISANTNVPGASGVWADCTSISLTAGDWQLTSIIEVIPNGATMNGPNQLGIGVNAGTNITDLVRGSNLTTVNNSSSENRGGMLGGYRLSLATTTTVYMKFNAVFTVATPQFNGRLSAVRTR